MPFNGKEGEAISLDVAKECTANYRATIPAGDTNGHFFGKEILQEILDQPSCKGIRIYYGIEKLLTDGGSTDNKMLVLTGVNAQENDMETGIIANNSVRCPPTCGGGGSLNS